MAHLLLAEFAPDTSEMHRRAFQRGEITFREYQERGFDDIEATVCEMSEFVRLNATLRPGFATLVKTAGETGSSFKVVSAGLTFYIRALLDAGQFRDIEVIAATATPLGADCGPFRYDYPVRQDGCDPAGAVCKCKSIMEAKAAGMKTMFIGDGLRSDACAAAAADVVFARGRLLAYCRDNDIPATPFDTFDVVAEFLNRRASSRD